MAVAAPFILFFVMRLVAVATHGAGREMASGPHAVGRVDAGTSCGAGGCRAFGRVCWYYTICSVLTVENGAAVAWFCDLNCRWQDVNRFQLPPNDAGDGV